MSTTEQAGNLGAQAAPAPRPRARKRVLVPWTIGIAILGFAMLFVYVVEATLSGSSVCASGDFVFFTSFRGGGQASGGSLVAATILAGCLWLAASVTAWRLRRRLGRLFAGFVGLYVVALIALWEISPLLWGQRYC